MHFTQSTSSFLTVYHAYSISTCFISSITSLSLNSLHINLSVILIFLSWPSLKAVTQHTVQFHTHLPYKLHKIYKQKNKHKQTGPSEENIKMNKTNFSSRPAVHIPFTYSIQCAVMFTVGTLNWRVKKWFKYANKNDFRAAIFNQLTVIYYIRYKKLCAITFYTENSFCSNSLLVSSHTIKLTDWGLQEEYWLNIFLKNQICCKIITSPNIFAQH